MLDIELCKMFGVDSFQQYLIKELEEKEEQAIAFKERMSECNSLETFIFFQRGLDNIEAKIEVLKEVRDTYARFLQSRPGYIREPNLTLKEYIKRYGDKEVKLSHK